MIGPAYPLSEAYDEIENNTSVLCIDCWTLTDGVPAGQYILWVRCTPCEVKREASQVPAFMDKFQNLLHLDNSEEN